MHFAHSWEFSVSGSACLGKGCIVVMRVVQCLFEEKILLGEGCRLLLVGVSE